MSLDVDLYGIHQEIDACTVCKSAVAGFKKPKPLDRGTAGPIMIIGQEPGKSELTSGRAFAGQSGKRLDEWLVAAGAARRHPRAGIYFTSVLKCPCPSSRYFRVMARNCSGFLRRQIETVKPDLIITLGKEAFELFNFRRDQFETAQCNPYYTRNEVLLTGYGFHFWILHLPHPSGANRWHNDQANRRRLDGALRFVTGFLGKGE